MDEAPARSGPGLIGPFRRHFPMMATLPSTAALCAAILGLLGAALTINVIVNRVKTKVDTGDGGIAALAQAIRAQGNFVEQAPLALIVIGLCGGRGRPRGGRLGACRPARRLAARQCLSPSTARSASRHCGNSAAAPASSCSPRPRSCCCSRCSGSADPHRAGPDFGREIILFIARARSVGAALRRCPIFATPAGPVIPIV